jgi:hypothetical protein
MKKSPAKVAAAVMQMKILRLDVKKPAPERAVLHNSLQASLRLSYREWQRAFMDCEKRPASRVLEAIQNDEVTVDSPADVRRANAQFRQLASASLKLQIIAGVNKQ